MYFCSLLKSERTWIITLVSNGVDSVSNRTCRLNSIGL